MMPHRCIKKTLFDMLVYTLILLSVESENFSMLNYSIAVPFANRLENPWLPCPHWDIS
jgi:hypothetical protein